MTMLTVDTTKEQLEKLTMNSFVLFVPNNYDAYGVIVSPGLHPKLYKFFQDYFYGYHNGVQFFKPYAYADCLLDEIEEEVFDSNCLATTSDVTPYATIQEFLKAVTENFNEDTIVICSHYE